MVVNHQCHCILYIVYMHAFVPIAHLYYAAMLSTYVASCKLFGDRTHFSLIASMHDIFYGAFFARTTPSFLTCYDVCIMRLIYLLADWRETIQHSIQ